MRNIKKSCDNTYVYYMTLFFLAMLWLQLFDSFTLSDDLAYHFVWQKDEGQALQVIRNFNDLINSQLVHYQILNGRLVVHTIAQFFLSFTPPFIYQFLNALLFVLLLYLSVRIMYLSKFKTFASILMCFLLFVVFSGFRTAILWSMGSFNYLWVIVYTLIFLLYLRKLYFTDNNRLFFHIIVSPLSIFIGCSHEGLSLPISITFFTFIIAKRKQILHQAIFLYICWYIIGTIICISSPGIWNRVDGGIPIYNRLLSGLINLISNVRITWLLVITLLILFKRNKLEFKAKLYQYRYVYLCLFFSLGIVTVCGTNLERVAFFTDFMAMLLLVELWSVLLSLKWQRYIIICCSILMILFYIPAVAVREENKRNCDYMKQQMSEPERELIAVRQPIKGENHIMDFFRERYVNPSAEFGFYCCYMGFNAQDINMRQAATLYGKKRMIFLPEDVILKIKSDSTAYQDYQLDKNKSLYVWKLQEEKPIKEIVFHLKPEDINHLWLHQRLVAYREDTYKMDDNFHYSIVHIFGHPYLIFTKPTTNIYRRIDYINYH